MSLNNDIFDIESLKASGFNCSPIWIRSIYSLGDIYISDGKGFGLSVGYNWSIMVDKVGVKVLVPTKR